MSNKLKVEYLKPADLKPCEQNPRHNDENVARIVKSIEAFGWTNPILVRRADRTVIAGHARLKAALAAGLAEVPVIFLDLDEADAKTYMIADNKLTELADWDEDALAELFAELGDLDVDLALTGFDKDEIAGLFSDAGDESEDASVEYTGEVDTPVYSPKGDKPEIPALFDAEKAGALTEKIEASGVTDDEKAFLIKAAQRHVVFDYHEIAEYYCHASEEMQRLMEDSALVIIDFDKAIEAGYVEVSKRLQEIYTESYGDGGRNEE